MSEGAQALADEMSGELRHQGVRPQLEGARQLGNGFAFASEPVEDAGGQPVQQRAVRIDLRRTAAVEDNTQLIGRQKRLRMLGYHIGHDGPSGNGVGAPFNAEMDRSILEFQGDKDKKMDGLLDAATAGDLAADAGA